MLVDQQLKVKEIHIQNVGCHPLWHLELNKIVAYWVVKRSFNIWSVTCSENVFDRFLELYKGNRVNVLKKPFTENGFYQPPLLKLDLNVIFSLAKITLHFDSTVSKERRSLSGTIFWIYSYILFWIYIFQFLGPILDHVFALP